MLLAIEPPDEARGKEISPDRLTSWTLKKNKKNILPGLSVDIWLDGTENNCKSERSLRRNMRSARVCERRTSHQSDVLFLSLRFLSSCFP